MHPRHTFFVVRLEVAHWAVCVATGWRIIACRYFVGVLGAAVVWLCLLAAYANQTVPNEWGTTKPWNFPCLACCGNSRRRRKRQARGSVLLQEELLESAAGVAGLSDGDSEGVSLRITHLRKVFGAGGCCKKRQSTEVGLSVLSPVGWPRCSCVVSPILPFAPRQSSKISTVLPTRARMMETVPRCIKGQPRRENVQRR